MWSVGFWNVHGKYSEPVIFALNYRMFITGWSAENGGSRMFTGRERTLGDFVYCIWVKKDLLQIYSPTLSNRITKNLTMTDNGSYSIVTTSLSFI